MGKVDLTLIRLAVYEMKYEEDIPTGVAINEAVELAKNMEQMIHRHLSTEYWQKSHDKESIWGNPD